jgi:hypothetical protein
MADLRDVTSNPVPQVDDGDYGAELPAVYVNRFYMRPGQLASRISLGELVAIDAPTGWRGAFLAGNDDWEALAHLILNTLGKSHPAPPPSGGAGTAAIFSHGKE